MSFKELFEAVCPFQNLYQVAALLDGRAIPIVQNRTASEGTDFMKYSNLDRWIYDTFENNTNFIFNESSINLFNSRVSNWIKLVLAYKMYGKEQ